MHKVQTVRGRLAPSPTGYLHLGNAWAFFLAWLAVRVQGGELVLRIEDIDQQRSRTSYIKAIVEDLQWLGLDWDFGLGAAGSLDGECGAGYCAQSLRSHLYVQAMAQLEQRGLLYQCFCSRNELRNIAAAPHIDDIGVPYPGTCRQLTSAQREIFLAQGRRPSIRLRCPEGNISFIDAVQGSRCVTLADCGGDFVVQRSDGVVAYQLAVSVDDGHMGVTQVLRGRDILSSTPRQIALLQLLGYDLPEYAHVPLLLDAAGQRLAKRHKSLSLRALRQSGAQARDVIGLLGYLAGINPRGQAATPGELMPHFSLTLLPRKDIRLTTKLLRAHDLSG